MDKNYDHLKNEGEIYKKWEEAGVFKPKDGEKKPFSIIMPPPNSNGELHLGHAIFVAVSDALIRYHRMNGSPTLWLPGVDHAGIQTQVTFEKKLKKEQNKSRQELGREEFVKQCYQFCMDCKHTMEDQFKALGASCDWSREKFTLDPEVSKLVYETFLKMNNDRLIYRGYRIVNWCPRCRSTLADVELERVQKEDKLYYVKYKLVEGGEVTIATARPETIWIDTHAAVNPNDEKRKHLIGNKIVNPLLGHTMEIVSDESVEMEFGTGILKLTPAHDLTDYEIAQKNGLPMKNGIDFDGRLMAEAGVWAGMKTMVAREEIEKYLQDKGLLEKSVPHLHEVAVCERCNTVIEPLLSRQWFVKIKALAEPAIKAVEEGLVKIRPEKYEAMYFNWMRNVRDWPISRQVWWGHQLPVWYKRSDQLTSDQLIEFDKLRNGDTRAKTDILDNPIISLEKPNGDCVQDPDTFDTWFSSGQWPVNTLKTSGLSDFEKFYPTSVMNTAYEILFLWVARMIMFGIYLTGKVPFETALINGVLRDEKGAKMSKSKGNGVNVTEAVHKYGADAVRMALLAGRDMGNDMLISKQQMEEKIRGYRNFANKIWNIARFASTCDERVISKHDEHMIDEGNEWIMEEFKSLKNSVANSFEKMRLGQAAEEIYEFVWHILADKYIEEVKNSKASGNSLRFVLESCLKLLHPFMPFVTEACWQELGHKTLLATEKWPE